VGSLKWEARSWEWGEVLKFYFWNLQYLALIVVEILLKKTSNFCTPKKSDWKKLFFRHTKKTDLKKIVTNSGK
jgi:hypothetical protein